MSDKEGINVKAAPNPTGVEAIVCFDIARRQERGIRKYGTTVADNPLPLHDWLQHAYEEHLDAAVYLRRAIDELDNAAIRKVEEADRLRSALQRIYNFPVRCEPVGAAHSMQDIAIEALTHREP